MLHSIDNLYFGRLPDGAVRIVKFSRNPHVLWRHNEKSVMEITESPRADGEFHSVEVLLDVIIPANHWASIIASVSAAGEGDGRYYKALEWHNAMLSAAPAQHAELVPKSDYDAVIHERDQWKDLAQGWSKAADAAQQPPEFYKGYSEGTMRAMQALLTRANIERDEARPSELVVMIAVEMLKWDIHEDLKLVAREILRLAKGEK